MKNLTLKSKCEIMKTCSKCKIEKPLESFHRQKDSKDGRSTICKECKKSYNRNDRISPYDEEFSDGSVRENQKWLVMIMPYQGSQVSRWNINVNQ